MLHINVKMSWHICSIKRIDCYTIGKAELYRWLRDDVDLKLPNATGFLTYDSFSENQTGEYKCQIKSPAGWTRITHAKSTIVSIGKWISFISYLLNINGDICDDCVWYQVFVSWSVYTDTHLIWWFQGSLLYHGLTISAWINNYKHYRMWDEITYPFPNFIGVCDYLSILGLKLNHVSKSGPWWLTSPNESYRL